MTRTPSPRPVGRPTTLPAGTRRTTVNLTPAEYETARRLGNGVVSAGIRAALGPCLERCRPARHDLDV